MSVKHKKNLFNTYEQQTQGQVAGGFKAGIGQLQSLSALVGHHTVHVKMKIKNKILFNVHRESVKIGMNLFQLYSQTMPH